VASDHTPPQHSSGRVGWAGLVSASHRVAARRQPHRHSLEPAVVAGREDTAERECVAHCTPVMPRNAVLRRPGSGTTCGYPGSSCRAAASTAAARATSPRRSGDTATAALVIGVPRPSGSRPWCGGGRSDGAVTGARWWVMPKPGRAAGPAGSPAR
jgi:hypothetical protein